MSLDVLKSACVTVRSPAAHGTAYLVGPTTLATCEHVIESVGVGGPVEILLPGGVEPAKVVKTDRVTDCAILELEKPLPGRTPLRIAGQCERKAQWDGFGFPKLAGEPGLPFFGMVLDPESLDDLNRPVLTLYSDMLAAAMGAPVHGLSGGPVVVDGAVVGHFSRILGAPGAPGQPALGVIYASRASNVLALLGKPADVPAVHAQSVASLSDMIPAVGPGEFHAFISYRSSDRAFAKRLHERLNAVGFRVFLDQRELVVGDQLATGLHQALGKSRCGIVLVSRGWLDSSWCEEEGNAIVARVVNERGRFRVIPLRIQDVEMPSMFAGRLWIDFSGESAPSGRKLDQVIYGILGQPAPPEGSVDAKVQSTLTDATDEVTRRVDAVVRDPTRFQSFLEFLRRSGLPEVMALFRAAEALIGAGRLKPALEILPPAEQSLRARQLRALALSKDGRDDEALALLEPLFEHGEIDAETGGILGGIYKRMWLRTGARVYLVKSYETYRVTYAATGAAYVGINVASTLFLLDRRQESDPIAARIRDELGARPEGDLDHWELATLGEAFLLLADVDNARRWYEKAAVKAINRPQDIAVMRRQARLLLPKLALDARALDDSLPVPPVVAFSGHLTDAPGRAVPRFPERKVEAVSRELDQWLRGHGGQVHAVCSAARGADLLFLEAVLKRRGTASVLLPFPKTDFKRASVLLPPGARPEIDHRWGDRFEAALTDDRVQVLPPLLESAPPPAEEASAFERCNLAIIDEAERLAALFDDTDPVLLTVWNGKPGDGGGGTAHAFAVWEARKHRAENVDVGRL